MKHGHLFVIALLLILVGCVNNNPVGNNASLINGNANQTAPENEVRSVEIIHFHGTHQCYSCITVGQYAQDTINTYFAQEVKDGKLSFKEINYDLPINNRITQKYGATGSSIWVGTYDSNGFHRMQDTTVWYKLDNKDDYKNYFKGVIQDSLSGGSD